MSMQDYELATKIIGKYPEKAFFAGPKSTELIELAERRLKLKFPPTYRRFLSEYGAGGLGSFEIYGIINDNFEQSSVPDAIWYTITERKEIELPQNLVAIYDVGNGELFCLDLETIKNDEAPIVVYQPGYSGYEQEEEIIAEDFGKFFLELVQREESYIRGTN